jgi:hypothetical protein
MCLSSGCPPYGPATSGRAVAPDQVATASCLAQRQVEIAPIHNEDLRALAVDYLNVQFPVRRTSLRMQSAK